jgi:integrase
VGRTIKSRPLTPEYLSQVMFPQQQSTKWATEGRRDGKAGGLSPQTRIHIHRVLYAGLARATEHDPPLLARNPASAFKKRLPKVERKELVTLTPEQSTLLLARLRHSRVYWPVLLALATGMRREESVPCDGDQWTLTGESCGLSRA